jgi:hypothetical protein
VWVGSPIPDLQYIWTVDFEGRGQNGGRLEFHFTFLVPLFLKLVTPLKMKSRRLDLFHGQGETAAIVSAKVRQVISVLNKDKKDIDIHH